MENILIKRLVEYISVFQLEIDEDWVLEKLQDPLRWPVKYSHGQPTVEMISNLDSTVLVQPFYRYEYLDYKEFSKFYDMGFTFILSNVLTLHPDMRRLSAYLQEQTGIMCSGNFYISKGGQKPSFDKHKHEYNVIVKQLYGKGFWKVENKVSHDTNDIVLEPQATLLIPKNHYHQVMEVKEPKLSLTINLC